MKILIIDDSKTMRKVIIKALETISNNECFEASNGKEGLKILQIENGKFDLIILDWNMPEMDGLEFAERLQAKNVNIPILMVTCRGAKEDVIKAASVGIKDYIIKPLTISIIKKKINQMFLKEK